MAHLRARGHDVRLAIFTPLGEYLRGTARGQWRARIARLRTDFRLPIRRIPSPPARARGLWDESRLLRSWIRSEAPPGRGAVVQCRGPEATGLARSGLDRGRGAGVSYDCRGLGGEEVAYARGRGGDGRPRGGGREDGERFDARERSAALRCTAMLCVSEAMRGEVVRRWGVDPSKITIIPCCTDVAASSTAVGGREVVRRRLGLEDRLVVGYCGSASAWELPGTLMAAFNAIRSVRADAHLLVITTQPETMGRFAREAAVPQERRTVLSVDHRDVPIHLAAADVGVLLREESAVNGVASPVKFAEYLACGLPVLISPGVGDFSALVERERLGWVVPAPGRDGGCLESVAGVAPHLDRGGGEEVRRRLGIARERFDWSVFVSTLESVHAGVLEERPDPVEADPRDPGSGGRR
jgi:glycosyltransferase involved in cell wall biosynthesis